MMTEQKSELPLSTTIRVFSTLGCVCAVVGGVSGVVMLFLEWLVGSSAAILTQLAMILIPLAMIILFVVLVLMMVQRRSS